MTSSISVIIGTFGDIEVWGPLAERAVRSAKANKVAPLEVIRAHGDTLHEARNSGAEDAKGEWLCFLDADDELDENYIGSMWAHARRMTGPALLQPSTLGLVDGREDPHPVLIASKPLLDGNFMVIGTLVRRDQFLEVGGFKDWPMYEDWCLWIRCWQHGAQLRPVPEAIYRVHVRENSRNQSTRAEQVRVYNEIRTMYSRRSSALGRRQGGRRR
jgi:glycosyltransferase involved in cell wall biosynthesis